MRAVRLGGASNRRGGPWPKSHVEGAAALAHEAGLTGVLIHVDSDDSEMVNACRLAGFQHDRTDVRYQIGEQR